MRILVAVMCCATVVSGWTAAQDAAPAEPEIAHLECPAEVTLPPEEYARDRLETTILADTRFCGFGDVEIPRVEVRWNSGAVDLRFEIVPPTETDVEIRLGARVYSTSGIEISSQSRTFKIKAGKTARRSLRLSRSSQWLRQHGGRLALVVYDISPS